MNRVACIIPTYNGCHDLKRLIDSIQAQTVNFDLIIVDSGSSDGTTEVARSHADNFVVISPQEFNHGGTRQMMVDLNPDYDFYVFLTQDAVLFDSDAIEKIVAHFSDARVGAVCGRQMPHEDANVLAQHARGFNYPDETVVKSRFDIPKLGLKAAFMSNSFAAYRSAALKRVGGFPSHVIFGEDMYAAAKMLLDGWKLVYAGDAVCRHSHNYSAVAEFRRYFDIGVFHAREAWLPNQFKGVRGEGMRYVMSELKFLGVRHLHRWPESLWRNGLKLVAYKIGKKERYLPLELRRKLGMHRRYWDGPFADNGRT